MTAVTPNAADVLIGAMDARLRAHHTGMPARVERYDAARQSIDAQPLVLRGYLDEADERATEALPVVTDVPVIFPGGGSYGMTFPLAVGDTVWLAVASCSIDRWLAGGGLVDPADDRRNALSDCVAIGDLRDFRRARDSAPTDCARLGHDTGAAIELRAADIRIGGGSGHQSTFKTTDFLTAFNTLIGSIATAVGTSGTPAGATASGTAIGTALTTFATDVLSAITTIAKVK